MTNDCPRCYGRTFPDLDGDRACLSCGWRAYVVPAEILETIERQQKLRSPRTRDEPALPTGPSGPVMVTVRQKRRVGR